MDRPLVACWRAWRRARDGGAAVEFALILPLAVVMLVLMVDLGTGGYWKARVQTAAQAGTAYVEAYGWNPRGIALAVRNATDLPSLQIQASATCRCASGTDLAPAACGNICPNGKPAGVFVKVSTSTVYPTLIPYPGFDRALTLSASSIVRVN